MRHALLTAACQPIQTSAADDTGVGTQSHRFDYITAAPNSPIHDDGRGAIQRFGNRG